MYNIEDFSCLKYSGLNEIQKVNDHVEFTPHIPGLFVGERTIHTNAL